MGGIAGILSFTRGRADTRKVERMLDMMRHRGPDDRGVRRTANGRLVVGGCRSVRDEAEAEEPVPMLSEREDVWAVLDGEIDNHRALRHSLCLDGHVFRSDAVGEVVVHAYEQYGPSFLDHLHGRFALAIWDETRHRLVLARDRLGERPLYWTRANGILAFASEAKVLLDGLSIPRRLDLDSLPEFFAHGFVLAPNTMFEGIRKLGPGEALVIERGNRLEPVTWWEPCRDERRSAAVRALSSQHHENNLRILLDSAIADRLSANQPIAAIMEDEPESLAMAAAMARLLGRSVDALMLGGRPLQDGEIAGLRVASVAPGAGQMLASLPDFVRAMDEPLADPRALEIWWLARAMSNHGIPIGLTSIGADAVMLGPKLLARHRRLPAGLRLLRGLPAAGRSLGLRVLGPLMSALGYQIDSDQRREILDGEGRLPSPDALFADSLAPLAPEPKAMLRAHAPAEALMRARRAMPPWIAADGLGALAYVETRTAVAEGQLMMMDRMSAAHSVELRHPFLDDAFVDYALSVPSGERASGGRPKDLLMRALLGLLPARPVLAPVAAPPRSVVGQWICGELGGIFENAVRHGGLFERGLVDRQASLAMLREHRNGREGHKRPLWALLILSQWFDLHGLDAPVGGLGEQDRHAVAG